VLEKCSRIAGEEGHAERALEDVDLRAGQSRGETPSHPTVPGRGGACRHDRRRSERRARALKEADTGVAMGGRGTDAAKEVADVILQDDRSSSIVAAVEQGRVIFGNICQSVMFMLCTNVAEIIAVAVASLAKIPLPLHPLQIQYLNVLTDVFPALALSVGKGSPEIMDLPPPRARGTGPHAATLGRDRKLGRPDCRLRPSDASRDTHQTS
jgi:hypothetical protein